MIKISDIKFEIELGSTSKIFKNVNIEIQIQVYLFHIRFAYIIVSETLLTTIFRWQANWNFAKMHIIFKPG